MWNSLRDQSARQKRTRRALWIIGLGSLLYVNLILILFGERELGIETAPTSPTSSFTTDTTNRTLHRLSAACSNRAKIARHRATTIPHHRAGRFTL